MAVLLYTKMKESIPMKQNLQLRRYMYMYMDVFVYN